MNKAYRALRRACWKACGDPVSGLQESFPALAARFAASAAPIGSRSSWSDAKTHCYQSCDEPEGADAAASRPESSFSGAGSSPGKWSGASQKAGTPLPWASAGGTSYRNCQSCRRFSAQPLPVKHADVPEPLGFVKGGYSVEQFPPDKVCAKRSA